MSRFERECNREDLERASFSSITFRYWTKESVSWVLGFWVPVVWPAELWVIWASVAISSIELLNCYR